MLDETDCRLLAALQRDGQATAQELGAALNLSASQAGRRRQRLEAEGFITGYGARVDPRRIGLALLDSLRALDISVNIVGQPWTTMVSRGSKPETCPNMISIYVTPVGTDPDTVAYQYHRASWGLYYGVSHYENPEVWRMIDEARGETDQAKRMALYAEIQRRIVADQPELFGMVANRIWARRDYVQGFEFSPVRFTGEIDLYPLWIRA